MAESEPNFLSWQDMSRKEKECLGERFKAQIALRSVAVEDPDHNIQGLRSDQLGFHLFKETGIVRPKLKELLRKAGLVIPPVVNAVEFRGGQIVKQGRRGETALPHSSISWMYVLNQAWYKTHPLDTRNKKVKDAIVLNGIPGADEGNDEDVPYYFSLNSRGIRSGEPLVDAVGVGLLVASLGQLESLKVGRNLEPVWPPVLVDQQR